MATDKKQVEIPGRLHSVATEGVVAGANEILDDNKGKNQQEINASVDDSLQENKTNIANEITRATNAENAIKGGSSKSIQNLDSRLSTVEAHDTISMEGGSVVVGTAEDFANRTTAGDAKIPTVGAILNGADEEPTAGSDNLVKSGGVLAAVQVDDILLNGIDGNINLGWIHLNGTFIKNQGMGFCIRVHENDTLYVKADPEKKSMFAFLKENVYAHGVLQYSSEYPSLIIITETVERQYTVPSDCKYVYFGQSSGDVINYKFPQEITLNGLSIKKTVYTHITDLIEKTSELSEEINDNKALADKGFDSLLNADYISNFVQNKRLDVRAGVTVDLNNPTNAPGWEYLVVDCQTDDIFTISAKGGVTNYFAWVTLKADNTINRRSEVGLVDDVLTIQENEVKVLVQNQYTAYNASVFKGKPKTTILNEKINGIEAKELAAEANIAYNGLAVEKDISSLDINNVIIPAGANPKWTASNACGVFIPIGDKAVIQLENKSSSLEMVYALLTSDSHVAGEDVPLSSYNSKRQGLATNDTIEIKKPDDATYLYIIVQNSSGQYIGGDFHVYLSEKGKLTEIDERLTQLETEDNWNLSEMTYGVDNECYTFWVYPAFIRTFKYRNKLIWSWCDNRGITGVGEYDLDSKVLKRRHLKKSDIDDHNAVSCTELSDGRIVFGYAGGHGYDDKEHFRITEGKEYVDYIGTEKSIDLGLGPTTYNQTLKIGDTYYIFCRVNRIGWAYFTTEDFVTFTNPVHLIEAPTGIQYYMKVAKVTDNPNMIRFVMYANASLYTYTEIRMGYIDIEHNTILNSDGQTTISIATPSSPLQISAFNIIVPRGGDDKCIRLFDLLESSMNDAVVAFARMPNTGSTSSGHYYVYHSQDNIEYEVGNSCGIEWIASRAPGGIAFIDETTLIVSLGVSEGNWLIMKYLFINGSWQMNKVIYSEDSSESDVKIKNIRPVVCTDGKYVMWQRGWYGHYMPSETYPIPFSTNIKIYDVENDEILF